MKLKTQTWTRKKLIKAYLDFFKSKAHKEIANSSLIPENDPTVLFTTAGMHPLVPFLLGQKHPQGRRLCNVQKCLRTDDINEVGDASHHTFFEMLGNWSLGNYWKKQAIKMSFEFLTKILKIPKERLAITCFKGDSQIKKDEESAKIWQSLGIPKEKIKFLGKNDNWWGPAGKTGPCGPDTEMFINNSEIWNDVFMQYNKDEKGNYTELKQKNVDTGMGVERTLAILNNLDDNYLTDSFLLIIKKIEELSSKKYKNSKQEMRIIADHIKAAVFMLAEKIAPSNKEQGYVLRRLIRRAIRYCKTIGIKENFTKEFAELIIKIYDDYHHLKSNQEFIFQELEKEEVRFSQNLSSGLHYFEKIAEGRKQISGKDAFLLYQSYGFPIEITQELAKEKALKVNMQEYEQEQARHQELSRTASAGKFKSGLADSSKETTKLHTATHLLNQALSLVLGKEIMQKGSNITPERLRFDFNFDRKLTEEELKKIEELINKKIAEKLEVKKEEMLLEEAKKIRAKGVFEHKYQEKVSVYSIGNFSKEICAGPHVKNTSELTENSKKFKIIKEEAVAAGIRRIKAVLG